MAHSHGKTRDRRNFLKLSAKLAALGITGMTMKAKGVFAAESAPAASHSRAGCCSDFSR